MDLQYQKYPTRDCGGQIDEGDFYQIIQEREDDETLTDSTERLLQAARSYIHQENAHVWRNAEVALLGPDDQLLFTSGTQANRFVVTFDDKSKVKVYCRDRSWNSTRNSTRPPEKGSLSLGSLVSRFYRRKQTHPSAEQSLEQDVIQPVQATRLHNHSNWGPSKGYTREVDIPDANEKYYSADENEIIPKQNGILKKTPKRHVIEEKLWSIKDSIMKNNVISSSSFILIGFLHMIRLFIVVYWQIFKCILKTITNR